MRRQFHTDRAGTLDVHDHVAWYGDGQEALDRLAVDVFTEGIRAGDRMMFVAEAPDADRLRGIEGLDRLLADGTLELARVSDAYRGGVAFDPAEQLATFNRALELALADGYRGIRVVADNTPLVRGGAEAMARWMVWEQLTDRFQDRRPVLGVCYFDRTQLPAARLGDLAAVHPVVAVPPGDEPDFRLFTDGDALRAVGTLDLLSVDRLRRVLAAVPGQGDLVVDLSGIDFADHRALLAFAQYAGTRAPIRLRNASPVLWQVWSVLDLPLEGVSFE